MIAILLATPYINIEVDQRGIQNIQGLMYLIITETIFTFSYSVFHTFPAEIPVLLREISNGLYKPGPYYLSKMLILVSKIHLIFDKYYIILNSITIIIKSFTTQHMFILHIVIEYHIRVS